MKKKKYIKIVDQNLLVILSAQLKFNEESVSHDYWMINFWLCDLVYTRNLRGNGKTLNFNFSTSFFIWSK